jgi:hypothetical protein
LQEFLVGIWIIWVFVGMSFKSEFLKRLSH